MRPLRLAVFTCHLPTAGQQRGGVARVAHELADGLARRGHAVTVWTHDPKPAGAAYDVRALPWAWLVGHRIGRGLMWGYLANVLALLPDYGRVDGIIAHGDSLLLPLLGRPVTRVMHGSALGEALSASSPLRCILQLGVYPQELLSALLHRRCVGVSANTRRFNPFVRHLIPNGVNLDRFRPDPAAKTAHPSVLFVGALTGRKRGALLVDWFTRAVRPRFADATLAVVGSTGPDVPGVSYHVGVDDERLADLYRRSWVYASPSSYEGFGLPYAEALASGTAVIATPNPGSREVLQGGKYGVLAADADFPDELVRLLGDAARRGDYAARGPERARDYSLEAMLDGYEALLRDGAASHGGRTDDRRRA